MPIRVTTSLRTAFQVGPAVLRAMGAGKHSVLLARAGSDGFEGHFPLRDLEFFLIPGEDDRPSDIRSELQEFLSGSGDREAGMLTVRYKAQAVDVAMILDGASLKAFSDWHIWTPEAFQAQFRHDLTDPTFLLTCKVVRLDPPMEIPWKDAYGASGPWVHLDEESLPAAAFVPVLEHVDFLKVAVDIKAALAEVQKNPVERPAEPDTAATPAKPAPPAPPKPAPPAPDAGGKQQAPAG